MGEMIKRYIDANIFLQGILYDDENINKILFKMVNKEFLGYTSVLSWDEIVFIVRKFLGKEIAIKEGEKFLKMPNLIFIDANKNIIEKSQRLINKYNIKPRDAIHVASALINGANEIISDDKDFDKIKEIKRIGIKK